MLDSPALLSTGIGIGCQKRDSEIWKGADLRFPISIISVSFLFINGFAPFRFIIINLRMIRYRAVLPAIERKLHHSCGLGSRCITRCFIFDLPGSGEKDPGARAHVRRAAKEKQAIFCRIVTFLRHRRGNLSCLGTGATSTDEKCRVTCTRMFANCRSKPASSSGRGTLISHWTNLRGRIFLPSSSLLIVVAHALSGDFLRSYYGSKVKYDISSIRSFPRHMGYFDTHARLSTASETAFPLVRCWDCVYALYARII